jgi:Cu-Zn family superoxide dismutase
MRWLFLLAFLIPSIAQAEPVTTHFVDAKGKKIGSAVIRDTAAQGMLIDLDLTLPPGTYALHFHATGICEGPGFKSCGGHFNPTNAKHGFLSAEGPHAGDLPNIIVGKSGRLQQQLYTPLAGLKQGNIKLSDGDGAALIIHAGADDYTTDPSGNAGDRVACAVVIPAPKP